MPGQEVFQASSLLDLAVSRPRDALEQARALVASRPGATAASYAHQAAGLVLRDLGQLPSARRELRLALRAARSAGDSDRAADVLASLAVALVMSGRTAECLDTFDLAVEQAGGQVLARVLQRRGAVLNVLGRHVQAIADLDQAAERSRASADIAWEGRARLSLVMSHLALGAVREADRNAERAEQLFAEAGQELEAAKAAHNRGLVAFQAGSLPAALGHLARAEERYDVLRVPVPELAAERCAVLLAAGLAEDALREVDEAVARGPSPALRADLLYAGASAALASGDPVTAKLRGLEAARLYRGQSREGRSWQARLICLAADVTTGAGGRRIRAAAADVAEHLDGLGSESAAQAHLLAGRLALGAEPAAAARHLAAAAAGRRSGSALSRATGELAAALLARAEGRPADVLRACSRGLAALDEHRLSLGAPDLQALASAHGRELTELALQETLRRGNARALLAVTERGRANALAVPAVSPPADAELARELSALRGVSRRLEQARAADVPLAALERERGLRERAVRRHRHLAPGAGGSTGQLDLHALGEALGDTTLVELVAVGGVLHALVLHRGRVRRTEVGPAAAALSETAHAHAALRRAAHGRPPDLAKVGGRLQAALLGTVAAQLGSGPVVVVPPNRLHSAPWGMLPALSGLPVAVTASATLWLQARSVAPLPRQPVVLVAGPGLGTSGGEIAPLTALHPGAVVLRDGTATVDAVLTALDGAGLVHVAAHGDFRADSPMFSSLRLDDGPLTVHDLDRLRRPPYRLVLSACESGVAASVGNDDLLGLSTALLGMGTAGVLASAVPVNDEASVPFACEIHAELAAGSDLPTALLAARQAAAGDPLSAATAASWLALGV